MVLNNTSALSLLIGMLATFMAISEQAECPANSTMDKCGGNACGPACDDPVDKDKGMWCPNDYCPGPACVCNQGFFRNPEGQCVVLEECPVRAVESGPVRCDMPCPEGQECWARRYQCFPAGSAQCPPNVPECKDIPPPDEEPTFNVISDTVSESPFISRCDKQCTGGKECWARQFNCTPAAPCPPNMPLCVVLPNLWMTNILPGDPCPAHSEARLCGTACEQTCQDVGKPLNCTVDMCADPGCKCKQGFYRNSNGQCVAAEQCQK